MSGFFSQWIQDYEHHLKITGRSTARNYLTAGGILTWTANETGFTHLRKSMWEKSMIIAIYYIIIIILIVWKYS